MHDDEPVPGGETTPLLSVGEPAGFLGAHEMRKPGGGTEACAVSQRHPCLGQSPACSEAIWVGKHRNDVAGQ
ncbi:MAG: hypothetical protein ABS81_05960 [Pseudonocardia sp. SCN 72-86]|nr:MAG: hypothetical protein ABS81_05960 [Pseudonocardia sp. SCN 72-86]